MYPITARASLQNSHYFGRSRQSVRFNPSNCDALCYGCHRIFEKQDREAYRAFKIKQLGQRAFDALTVASEQYAKKDYKLAAQVWKQALLDDFGIKI